LFSPGTPVSSTGKIDSHYITEILLKVALNTINPNPTPNINENFKALHCLLLQIWRQKWCFCPCENQAGFARTQNLITSNIV
jgi:hypothetical protein